MISIDTCIYILYIYDQTHCSHTTYTNKYVTFSLSINTSLGHFNSIFGCCFIEERKEVEVEAEDTELISCKSSYSSWLLDIEFFIILTKTTPTLYCVEVM